MDAKDVSLRFDAGKAERSFGEYAPVVRLAELFYFFVAIGMLWDARLHEEAVRHVWEYAVVLFCFWKLYRAEQPSVFVCENGLVIKRRPADMYERFHKVFYPDDYYVFAPYESIMGFTERWEELHVVTPDGGILIVPVDLQFVSYRDKLQLLDEIDDKTGYDSSKPSCQ